MKTNATRRRARFLPTEQARAENAYGERQNAIVETILDTSREDTNKPASNTVSRCFAEEASYLCHFVDP